MTLKIVCHIEFCFDQGYLRDRSQSELLIGMDVSRDQVAGELKASMRLIRALWPRRKGNLLRSIQIIVQESHLIESKRAGLKTIFFHDCLVIDIELLKDTLTISMPQPNRVINRLGKRVKKRTFGKRMLRTT